MLGLLDNCGSKLLGLKFLDLKIMKKIFSIINCKQHNTIDGRKEIIDLKFHFHQPPEYPPGLLNGFRSCGLKDAVVTPIPPSNRYDQTKWEDRHSFDQGSTRGMAKGKMLKIYDEFFTSCQLSIDSQIQGLRSSLNSDYISGIIDGNGCLFISKGRRSFSINFANGNEQVLLEIARYFQDREPRFSLESGSQSYRANRKEVIKQINDHLKTSPLLLSKEDKWLAQG